MNRWIYLIVIFSLSMVILTAGCGKEEKRQPEAPLVKTLNVGTDVGVGRSSYAGEVKGRYESQLAFQVGGKILKRNVNLGDHVKAGDVLMEIDAKDLAQTENIASAQVASARSQLELAETNLSRYGKLLEQAAISQAQYDQYRTSYDAALATLTQAQAQYEQSSNALSYSRLTAEADGVISAVSAEAGQVVAAGQNIVTLVKDGEVEVEIHLPENRLGSIAVGEPVTASFWALKGLALDGRVREIAPMADAAARTYKVRISLVNPPPSVRLGMTSSIAAAGGQSIDLAIPLSAVYQTGDIPQVWVVEGKNVHLKPIEIAAFGDNQVKVLSGIKRGDTIVVAGVHKLREGQEVRLFEGESE